MAYGRHTANRNIAISHRTSVVAERLGDASCLSVVGFNST